MSDTTNPATRSITRGLRRFREDRGGNIALIGGLFTAAAIPLSALAVDVGSLYLERRNLQQMADLAAITATANISNTAAATKHFLQDNGVTDFSISIVPAGNRDVSAKDYDFSASAMHVLIEEGHYTADPSLDPENRFSRDTSTKDAVRVTIRKAGALYFGGGIINPPLMETTGTTHASSQAAFSVGSRLLRLDGGILNAILNGLLGTNVALDVVDYDALVDADIDILSFLDTLATALDIKAGTYDELLDSDVSIGQFAKAMAKVARGKPSAISALGKIGSDKRAASRPIALNRIVNLGSFGNIATGASSATFDAQLSAMEMLSAAAAVAGSNHQVKLDLGLSAPGVAELMVDLAIGERPQISPWFAIGETGSVVRTAQTRLFLELRIGGIGVLSGTTVRLPLYLELTYGEAQLDHVSCPQGNPRNAKVYIDARPGVADLWIADIDRDRMRSFGNQPRITKASIVDTKLIRVDGLSHVEIGNTSYGKVSFSHHDIANQATMTVSTRGFTKAAVKSLIGNLELDAKVGGLGLNSSASVQSALVALLSPIAEPVDKVIHNLLAVLGVKIGQADIRAYGVTCGRAVLVQ